MAKDAEAKGVDERISRISFIKPCFATHGGKSDAVAVVGNAGNDTRKESAVGGGIGSTIFNGAEAQRIEEKNRTCAHREDVTNDATDSGGGTLERLDGAGVIVAFDFKSNGPTVPNVENTRVFLAGLDENARPGSGKFFQLRTGVFIGAMLAPHDGKNTQLGEIRIASENFANVFKLLRSDAVFCNDIRCDGGLFHDTV